MPKEITQDDLTRLSLDSHFLTWRPLPEETTEAVSQICGLNAQTARGPFISLWTRMAGFTRDSLIEATYEEKTLIKAWLMRGTVHIVPTADYPTYQMALRQSLCERWETSLKKQTLVDLPRTWTKLLDAIVNSLGEGPLVKKDLLARVKGLIKGYSKSEQKRLVGWALRLLTYQGRVCHDRPTGPWYHFKDNRFALVTDWLPSDSLEGTDEEEARHDLLIKYLAGYGPATVQDFAYWTGFRMPQARRIFEAAKERLAEIRVKGVKRPYWILEDQIDSLEDRDEPPPVSFLPEFDPLIMGHKDKSRILDPEYRSNVFKRLATVKPTFLVGGSIAGTWDYSFSNRCLEFQPFRKVSRATRESIQAASENLRQFLER